ncbi:MAG TPA: hypothetical protein VMW16_11970 [Sedimentisphaerales bacterium]|nr:hypothetical protein [Sedimentisphaerales bacterium]
MNIHCRSICRVVGGIVLTIAPCVLANQEQGANVSPKLPPEIQAIIKGNQATVDSVRTIQATIESVATISFGSEGTRKLMTMEKIWYDRDHLRRDTIEGKFIGSETEPLLVTVPILNEKGYFRPPPSGEVEIDSNDFKIDYEPSNNTIFVHPPEWTDKRRGILMNKMLKYQSVRGGTLKENVLLSAKNGYYFTTESEKIDGDDCILLTCNYDRTESTLKIWVVPSKGYCIKKVQDIIGAKVVDEYVATLKEYSSGIWWFDTIKAESHKHGQWKSHELTYLSVKSLTFNKTINSKVFTIADIKTPSCGARLINEVSRAKE